MRRLIRAAMLAIMMVAAEGALSARAETADAALVLAVDVSGSVNPERYALQMEGIARAFEDSAVQAAILAGLHQSIFVTMVEWSNRPAVSIPWMRIASTEDARALAARIRHVQRVDNQFTCMAAALQLIGDKVLPFLPGRAERVIVDVSGDGHDNCNSERPTDQVRDELVASGVTVNGLPILEGEEAATLESWYRDHVIGGAGSFLAPALGFEDFGRAMRSKFILEISRRSTAAAGG